MLTVLLATRNRARVLHEVLQSFVQLCQPSSGWKVVIVDNGSVDQTEEVIRSFSNRLPIFPVLEPCVGKNCALNTGLGLVEGDLTVLTDDDVFPKANWLIELRRAADEQPAYSIFGGAILPRWEAPPPCWVGWIDPGPIFTLSNPSLAEGPIRPSLVFGPNMAIRTSIFRSGVRFDASMGPRGSNYPMGSETELVCRLDRQGHKAWYVENAVVEHFIRQEQLTERSAWRRAVRYGRGQFRLYYMEQLEGKKLWLGPRPYLFTKLVKIFVQMGIGALAVAAAHLCLGRKTIFRCRWRFGYRRGQAIEVLNIVRDGDAKLKRTSPDTRDGSPLPIANRTPLG